MYTITVNKTAYKVDEKDKQLLVNGIETKCDIYRIDAEHAHILVNNVSYRARIVSANYADKSFKFVINNHTYDIHVQDRFDILLKDLGMDKLAAVKVNHIYAPMPGLVLRLIAEAGATLKKGDSLLVLEAMKMENVLKAPADMNIKSFKVSERQAVEKGQMLIEVE